MTDIINKTVHVYKNHGLKAVARKARSVARYRYGHLHPRRLLRQETLAQKDLRDEFNFVANPLFQITSQDIEISKKINNGPAPARIKTAVWFTPYFDHIAFGGIQTIFRFIDKLGREGVKNIIVIYDRPGLDVATTKADIAKYFPNLVNYELVVFGEDKDQAIAALPPSDIAFCTMWVSAYVLLRYNKTKRKYYFIQDYEPLFYVAGSTYALAESTYRFGFRGVVNTPGLLAAINQRHGLEGISFVPAVNRELYYPDPKRNNQKVRIFFYARPTNPRNAFNLGILTIKHLLQKYGGDKIEVIAAGAEWDERDYGLHGQIINKGLIKSIEEVAALYRSCDIGFSFMLNKHPSYQILEYAASGVATVINYNEDHGWLYKDQQNCLLSEPSPAAMAEKISQLIDNPKLRQQLVDGAQAVLNSSWDKQTDLIWNDIKHN